MIPQGAFDEATNPPRGWAAAPAPTAIVVTPGTANSPARVRLEWPDNVIQNRWLQVRVLANAAIGVPATQEFYLGNLQGEINGALLGGNYFVQNADLTTALPVGGAGSPGSVSSIRDVDKNGFILNSDFIAIRLGIVNGLVLRNITIPATGSGAALPRAECSFDLLSRKSNMTPSVIEFDFSLSRGRAKQLFCPRIRVDTRSRISD